MGKVRSVTLAILATLLAAPGPAPTADASSVFPAPIILAARVIESDNPGSICTDVFSRTQVQYQRDPTSQCDRAVRTFAGWRIGSCSTHPQCAALGHLRWWPATRLGERGSTLLGRRIGSYTTRCPGGGGGPLPADTISGVSASAPCTTDAECTRAGYRMVFPVFGFDVDDHDGPGPSPPIAVTPDLPCGLPYRLVQITFLNRFGTRNIFSTRLFKVIIFEQWESIYGSGLWRQFPQFAAIPPLPDLGALDYDVRLAGGGRLPGGDFRSLRLLLDDGDYVIDGGLTGSGVVAVDGSLTVNGPLEFSGTLLVRNTLTLGRERGPGPPSRER